MIIERGDPRDPASVALLEASHVLMESLFPPEDNHYLSIDALCVPDVHFFIAREGDETLGCGAIKHMGQYAEIKSMFTCEAGRGRGVATAILTRLEKETRTLNLPEMRLETGNSLHAAHRLYVRHGFEPCGPFGDYDANDTSLFMKKRL